MLESEFFWSELQRYYQQYTELWLLSGIAAIFCLILFCWKPKVRQAVAHCIYLLLLAAGGFVASNVLAASMHAGFTHALASACQFLAGLAFIRLTGLFLFRFLLPACRLHLASVLEQLLETSGYYIWLLYCLQSLGLELSSLILITAGFIAALVIAMHDVLNDVVGSLLFQVDNSIKIGDWISIDEISGRVVAQHWRYTTIETRNWESVILPNSLLLKHRISILGKRDSAPLQWRRWVYFQVGYEHPAAQIIKIAENAVRYGHIGHVADDPKANCLPVEFYPQKVKYALRYWLTELEADDTTDAEVHAKIYSALANAGIFMIQPLYPVNGEEETELGKQLQNMEDKIATLTHVELFKTLQQHELLEIAEKLVLTPFAKGDVICRQSTIAHWLFIIVSGSADVFLKSTDGTRKRTETIHVNGLLGEMGLLTGEPRNSTVIANSEVLAYRLDKEAMQKIMENRPAVAKEISEIVAMRRLNVTYLQQKLDQESINKLLKQNQKGLLEHIRVFFNLDNR